MYALLYLHCMHLEDTYSNALQCIQAIHFLFPHATDYRFCTTKPLLISKRIKRIILILNNLRACEWATLSCFCVAVTLGNIRIHQSSQLLASATSTECQEH